jgi:hypothetical protein
VSARGYGQCNRHGLHPVALDRVERALFVPDPVGHRHAAEVVEQCGEAHGAARFGGKRARLRGPFRKTRHPRRVRERVDAFHVDEAGERERHALQLLGRHQAYGRRFGLKVRVPDTAIPESRRSSGSTAAIVVRRAMSSPAPYQASSCANAVQPM